MILSLIRHGKTEANEKRLYCGWTDLPLSPSGEEELYQLKGEIVYPRGELYITSGLLRTTQTMNILFDNPKIKVMNNLREMHFGNFEMHSYNELKHNDDYLSWISGIEHVSPPFGESKQIFKKRVINGLYEIMQYCNSKKVETVVIVTHGGVIATLMEFFCPGQKDFYEWQPSLGRGYSITIHELNNIKYKHI